jgi:hypothetical protein
VKHFEIGFEGIAGLAPDLGCIGNAERQSVSGIVRRRGACEAKSGQLLDGESAG